MKCFQFAMFVEISGKNHLICHMNRMKFQMKPKRKTRIVRVFVFVSGKKMRNFNTNFVDGANATECMHRIILTVLTTQDKT